jgi:hypothetical protein
MASYCKYIKHIPVIGVFFCLNYHLNYFWSHDTWQLLSNVVLEAETKSGGIAFKSR